MIRDLTRLDNHLYLGTTLDADPNDRLGRVRVAIDGLTDELKDSNPDDIPLYLVLGSANGGNNEGVSIPQTGSRVLVSLINNDIYNGVVLYALPFKPKE